MEGGTKRERIIQQLRSDDNALALEALADLRARGNLTDGSLQGVSLDQANLEGADLSGANLQGTALIRANLRGAILRESNLKQAGLRLCNLQEASLWSANLEGASLVEANLERARLDEANLRKAALNNANLQHAFASNANLTQAKLVQADLRAADFSWATVDGADFEDANLLGVMFSHTDLQKAQNLTDAQLAASYVMWLATLPAGYRYDGRFRLAGDLAAARARSINVDDADAMAAFYEVSPEAYKLGQHWAEEHLPDLRDETRYHEDVWMLWGGEPSRVE